MENAAKALLMGASVLVVILIISLAKQIFGSASSVTKTYDSTMDINEIRAFNQHFTRFMGATIDGDEDSDAPIQKVATIHDIVTTANFAYDQNRQIQGSDCFKIDSAYEGINDAAHIRIDIQAPKYNNDIYIFRYLELYPSSRRGDKSFINVYNNLLETCYYENNAEPNVRQIIQFDTQIGGTNGSGKINHVIFITDSKIGDRLEDIQGKIPSTYIP